MYKATVNKKIYDISNDDQKLSVNNAVIEWDLLKISPGYFHLLIDHKSYRAEVVMADPITKTFEVKINGRLYPVQLKDKFDLLLDKMGMNNGAAGKANSIKAPMPGLIIDLRVSGTCWEVEGATVVPHKTRQPGTLYIQKEKDAPWFLPERVSKVQLIS